MGTVTHVLNHKSNSTHHMIHREPVQQTYIASYRKQQQLFYGAEKLTTQSQNSPQFTQPEGSLPCSQEPVTGPYPKPDNPARTLQKSILYEPSSSERPLPFRLPDQTLYTLLTSVKRATCSAHLTILDF